MDNIKREKSFAAAGIQAPDHPARSLLAISTTLFRLPIKGTESDVFVPRWELMFCVSRNTLDLCKLDLCLTVHHQYS
jgi:hypothetical protein